MTLWIALFSLDDTGMAVISSGTGLPHVSLGIVAGEPVGVTPSEGKLRRSFLFILLFSEDTTISK
jgi:hypothetical protein